MIPIHYNPNDEPPDDEWHTVAIHYPARQIVPVSRFVEDEHGEWVEVRYVEVIREDIPPDD